MKCDHSPLFGFQQMQAIITMAMVDLMEVSLLRRHNMAGLKIKTEIAIQT